MELNDKILDKLETLEIKMMKMFHRLEERLSAIETNFEQASQLANGLIDGNPLFNRGDLEQFKDSFMNPKNSGSQSADSISEMMESLKGFKDRLSGIQETLRTQVIPSERK